MKRFFVAAGLLLIGGVSAIADQLLTINGETVEKTVTRITFDGDNVVLHFGDETSSHDMESVSLKFKKTDAIANIQTGFVTGLVGDMLFVEGIEEGARLEVYNIQGMLCTEVVAAGNSAEIDMSGFNAGVSVLRAGNQVVKFVK